MRILQAKTAGQRTPEQMAKAAMKQRALTELKQHGLDCQAEVTVKYMGISHTLYANPTVNVKNGQIMFHFGAVGANRLPFGVQTEPTEGDPETHELSFGLGGNVMTGLEIDGWQSIATQFGLISGTTEADDLEAGETV